MDYFPMQIDFTSANAFGNGCVIYFYTVGFLRSSMTNASNMAALVEFTILMASEFLENSATWVFH